MLFRAVRLVIEPLGPPKQTSQAAKPHPPPPIQHNLVVQACESVKSGCGMEVQINAVVHFQELVAANKHRTYVVVQARFRLKIDRLPAVGRHTILDMNRREPMRVCKVWSHVCDHASANDGIGKRMGEDGSDDYSRQPIGVVRRGLSENAVLDEHVAKPHRLSPGWRGAHAQRETFLGSFSAKTHDLTNTIIRRCMVADVRPHFAYSHGFS